MSMKHKLILLTTALAIAAALTSCLNLDKEIITDTVYRSNFECPKDMGEGMIMNAVKLEGRYVVFYFNYNGVLYDSQEEDWERTKTSAINYWHRCAQDDDGVKEFLLALKRENVGIIHNFTDDSGNVFKIVIKAKEL